MAALHKRHSEPRAIPLEIQLNALDNATLVYLNEFLGQSGTFDAVLYALSDNVLLQGFVPATALWYLWFRPAEPDLQRDVRERILAVLFAAMFLVLIARGLALMLPFRNRPMSDPSLPFQDVHPEWGGHLYGWSSFPSDHAVLFFALACGLLSISRAIGMLLLVHAFLIDSLPRVYLGYHYPTDILAGALLGSAGTLWLINTSIVQRRAHQTLMWSQQQLGLFYAALTLVTIELATMFESILHLSKAAFYVGRSACRHLL